MSKADFVSQHNAIGFDLAIVSEWLRDNRAIHVCQAIESDSIASSLQEYYRLQRDTIRRIRLLERALASRSMRSLSRNQDFSRELKRQITFRNELAETIMQIRRAFRDRGRE